MLSGWSTSCSMRVIRSGGNIKAKKRLCPFSSFKERILKAASSSTVEIGDDMPFIAPVSTRFDSCDSA